MTQEQFLNQSRSKIEGFNESSPIKAYRLDETGQVVFEIEVESKKGGKDVVIAALTDVHINVTNEADESDEEVMYSKKCRGTIFAEPGVVEALTRAMEVCALADLTVVTGDLLDYLTCGGMEVAKKEILEKTDSVMFCAAIHDISKNCMTNLPDKLSYDQRIGIIKEIWPNDTLYEARTYGDKVTAIAIDNDTKAHYQEPQYELLKKDIEEARREGRIVLLFQHRPISTTKEENRETPSLITLWKPVWNLYDKSNLGGPEYGNEVDRRIIDLIRSNADVVKGIFCGHYHDVLYTEIPATYEEDGKTVEAVIPQYNMASCPYLKYAGILTRIVIK